MCLLCTSREVGASRIHAALLECVTELIQGGYMEFREDLKGTTMILRGKKHFLKQSPLALVTASQLGFLVVGLMDSRRGKLAYSV